MTRLLAALALLFVLAGAAQAADRQVLPTGVRPRRYAIEVAPDAAALTFAGKVAIELTVERATDRIVLNAADLKIKRAALSGRSDAPRVLLDPARQTATLLFPTPIARGRYELSIAYSGRINRQASGLFALDYATPRGQRRALFTQFENADARRFVPCWDEPGIKAVFSLTLVAPRGQMAVSNMPVAEAAPRGHGRQAVRFHDSPKMSPYLAFLALGDFERVSRKVGEVDVGVVVRRGDAPKAGFALDAAARLLAYYNDYFGAPYPLPKLDLVAGPGQSQFFGAMENWGAIFVFDYALLLNPKLSTNADRRNVFTIVAHEMAHQWFGDLVTMTWWDDLWLNEGFASWMENKAADHFHPEWNIWLQAADGRERAMRLDARAGTHPIITPIPDVLAAANAFDSITYQKGEAVIRMLEAYAGEDAFRAGVRRYIARHAYGNTVTDDLWAEIDQVSPRPVTAIAHDFTRQAGVPLVRAEQADGVLRLTQSRFGVDAAARAPQTWRVPVDVQAPDGSAPWRLVLEGAAQRPSGQAGVVVNPGQSGYFRTAYDAGLWAALLERLPALGPADQLGLIYDSRALGETGDVPLSRFLQLASRLPATADPVVATALVGQLAAIDDYYEGRPGRDAWRAFARARLQPPLARLGWDARPGEPDNDAVLRAELLETLGGLGDPAVVAQARRRFARYRVAPSSLSGAGRQSVLAIMAGQADAASWDQLHGLARAAQDPTDRSRLYRLLGASHDPVLANRALALSGEPPVTAAPGMIAAVARLFPERAFEFALAHRAAVEALLEPGTRASFLTSLAQASRRPETAERLLAFARASLPASAYPETEKSASAIRFRAQVIAERLPELDRWLAAAH